MSFPQRLPPEGEVKETYVQKGWRKCKEQPIVPIGVVLTCIAFLGATRSLRTGDKTSFNRYLRFRVLAQGITVLGCVAGAWWIGREARLEGMRQQREAAARGEVRMRTGGAFDEGLRGRMREAEVLWEREREADERLGVAGTVPLALPTPPSASPTTTTASTPGTEEGKTSAEVNAAIARARQTPPEKKSKEIPQEPMRIQDLLGAGDLKERLERRAKAALGKKEREEQEKVDEERKV